MEKLFSYDDIVLVPKYSELCSRRDADTTATFLHRNFRLPVVPANMSDVISIETAKQLSNNGYFYIMHRFGSTDRYSELDGYNMSISVGVNDIDREFLVNFIYTPQWICIDVAHAHHKKVEDMLKFLHNLYSGEDYSVRPKFIVGNTCTPDGYKYLCDLGADAVKVGIGGGCFVPDTPVFTSEGYKSIQDVKVGDKVLTHKNSFEEITNTFSEERNEELIKINDKIQCTSNHEFYVVHKKFEDVANENNVHQYAEWVRADELTDEYFLVEM